MSRFLLDANLSPETSSYLRDEFNIDAVDAVSLGIWRLPDVRILEYAQKDGRVIITFGLDRSLVVIDERRIRVARSKP